MGEREPTTAGLRVGRLDEFGGIGIQDGEKARLHGFSRGFMVALKEDAGRWDGSLAVGHQQSVSQWL